MGQESRSSLLECLRFSFSRIVKMLAEAIVSPEGLIGGGGGGVIGLFASKLTHMVVGRA